jgi:hypothetical protein
MSEPDPKVVAWRAFQESPDSLNFWVEGPDGTWSRGNPKKVPFEVRRGFKSSASSRAYWKHYGYNDHAPYLPGNWKD